MSKHESADDPLADLTREEKQVLAEIARGETPDGVTRRDALKAAGLLGGGALLGGGGALATTKVTTRAEAGTQESGTIGTATDPADAFLEDVSGPGGNSPVSFQNDISAPGIDTEEAVISRQLATPSRSPDLSQYNPGIVTSDEMGGVPLIKEHPAANNPVLTDADVTDISDGPTGTADPFVRFDTSDGLFHMLFEVLGGTDTHISHATSPDGLNWTYDQEVTDDAGNELNTSYPHFFQWDETWYLHPDSGRLYSNDTFTTSEWTEIETIQQSFPNIKDGLIDTTLFYYDRDPQDPNTDGRWWAFAGRKAGGDSSGSDEIAAYHSGQTLQGPDGRSWSEPSWSPLTGGSGTDKESPAGRPIKRNGAVDMPYEDEGHTPSRVQFYRYTDLNTSSVTENELPKSRAYPGQFGSTADNGTGVCHQFDYVAHPAAVGDSPIFILDTGTDWEIVAGAAAETPPKTYLRHELTANRTTTANTFSSINWGSTLDDTLKEYDTTNDQFTPTETGIYHVYAVVRFSLDTSATDNDRLAIRLQNVTDGSTVLRGRTAYSRGDGNEAESVEMNGDIELTAGKAYEVQPTNRDNDDAITGIASDSHFHIERKFETAGN